MSTAEAMTYLGVKSNGCLASCPLSPSGVGSCYPDDKKHYLSPIAFKGSAAEATDKLKAIMQTMSSVQIVQDEGSYLHYERESLIFRIVSDVEFLVDEKEQRIHFRAAQRYGYWDMGSNARFIGRIKDIFVNLSL